MATTANTGQHTKGKHTWAKHIHRKNTLAPAQIYSYMQKSKQEHLCSHLSIRISGTVISMVPFVCRCYFTLLPKHYQPSLTLSQLKQQSDTTLAFFYPTPPNHCSSLSCQLWISLFLFLSFLPAPFILLSHFVPDWRLSKSITWTHAWPQTLPVKLEVNIPVRCGGIQLPLGVGIVPQSICLSKFGKC